MGSYDAPGGIEGTDLASIGETGGITGSCIGSLCRGTSELCRGTSEVCRARRRPWARARLGRMYEVLLLAERALAESDARMIADLYGEVEDTTHLHILLPLQDVLGPIEVEEAEERRSVFGVDVAAWVPGTPSASTSQRVLDEQQGADEDTEAALQRSLDRLRAYGIDADGETVPHEPLDALRALVAERHSEEVVILTRTHALSETFRTDWASKARRHLDVPVLHLLEHAES